MTIPYYYVYPFGQDADDLTAIPTSAAPDGSVSYQDGWTDPYEYNLETNPAALPIPRGQMNQLFFDITNNLQEYQQYGTPQWVTGNTVLYPIYARVYYIGKVYENQVANNTQTPGVDNTWLVISGNNGGVPIGTVIDFAGPIVPSDYLICDGSAISRTTYAALLSSISQTQTGTTTNTLFTITGLSDTSKMFVNMAVEGAGIPLGGALIVSIDSSSQVTVNNAATSTATAPLKFFSWGNGNGSTTFNLPDQRRKTKVGSGGTGTSTLGNVTGQGGGVESSNIALNQIPNHTHDPLSPGTKYQYAGTGVVAEGSSGSLNEGATTGGVTGFTSQTPFSVIQPSNIYTQCIKYQ